MDNVYSEEDVERCTLTSAREIAFQIKGLIKRGSKVSVAFHEGRQGFLTILTDMSLQDGLFYFDVSGSDEINREFLKAESCAFTALVEGVRIQFSAKGCHETKLRGETLFAARIPQNMLRLQRRDTFRLPLPGVPCRVREGTPNEELLTLRDISVSGIGVSSTTPLDYAQLDVLENCWIDLRENGTIRCALEVRYVRIVENRAGKPVWHMGCRFIGLPLASEMQIQRFLARIEAERLALAPG
ncbi:MAG: flagellar brake protein [Candidatus Accumulibacter sp.]|jgi:c-di-GMP-binding flagellar brake protein YcgR|nr:flagellar brake protein [Accumulibacter sp.]